MEVKSATMSRQPFLEMPLHLLRIVLSDLDCMDSLAAAILSHSSFYVAFSEDSTNIISRILGNQIPVDLLPYSIAVYEATRIDHCNSDHIMKLLLRFFSEISPPSQDVLRLEHLEPAAAKVISKTHSIVEHFSHDFVKKTLPLTRNKLGLYRPDYSQASAGEVFRIRRALYRFQLYCNLQAGGKQRDTSSLYQQYFFFGLFSPWVNEQLACIHDYLEQVLSSAFDKVAAHDVEWGARSVNWLLRGRHNEYKQGFLSYGLDFLFKLSHVAQSYDERLQILEAEDLPNTKNMLAAHFKRATIVEDPVYYPKYFAVLGQWGTDDLELLRNPKTDGPIDDSSSGPFRMWHEAHKECYVYGVVYAEEHSRLRRCGYVLWDAPERPIEGGLRDRLHEARRQRLIDHLELSEAGEQMRRSWEERAEIYRRGGRGFWSEGDLSGIVWSEAAS